MSGAGTPYRVFTPYSRASLRLGPPSVALGSIGPDHLTMPDVRDDGLDSLQLGTSMSGEADLARQWQPGESEAWRRTTSFIETRAADYGEARDRPGIEGTSRLSPHLHFGEISPRSLWHAVAGQLASNGLEDSGLAYLRQLLWRDFAHQLLFHFPHITERAFKPAFDGFPWRDHPDIVYAWQSGATGIPLIDAGMRELRHTGFMHNRVRWIHSPWTAPEETLSLAGVSLDEDYPEPVLDLKESRRRALAAYKQYVAGR